jgi:hypothetical protein
MLRTREFDQRHADGDRPRQGLLSPASSPPRFCRPVVARSASRDNSKHRTALHLRFLSPKTHHATELQRRQNLSCDKNHSTTTPCRKVRLPRVGQLKRIGRLGQHGRLGRLAKTSPFSSASPGIAASPPSVFTSYSSLVRLCAFRALAVRLSRHFGRALPCGYLC